MKRFALFMLLMAALACNATTATTDPTQPPPATDATEAPPTDTPAEEPTATDTPTEEQPATDVPPTAEPTFTPIPATATPAPTATPFVDNADYGVVMVEEGDVLNVRDAPSPNADKVAEFLPIFAAIQITGPEQVSQAGDGGIWVPVQRLDVEGWVNRYYITQVVPSAEHCGNAAAESIVDDVRTAVANQDGQLLASLVHPDRGLHVRYNWWNTEVRFSQSETANLFTTTQTIDWGQQQGSGNDISGPPSEVIVPLLERDLLADNRQRACNEILAGPTAGLVQTPPEYLGFNYYSVYRPAGLEENEFDWGTWVMGIEYRGDTPYLVYLVHYEYEV